MPKPLQQPAVRNRRYADFWSQRKNQCWAGALVAAFSIVAIVGVAYLISNGISNKVSYNGDALLRLFPKTGRDNQFLRKFDNLSLNAQVWGLPVNPNVPIFLYVKAGALHRVEKTLMGRNLTFTVLIPNMQDLIDSEERTVAERRSLYSSEEFDFENYHPLEEINEWLQKLPNSSSLVNVTTLGTTHEHRDILLVKISTTVDQSSGLNSNEHHGHTDKPVIYVNCGTHAREWISISTCIWMINRLANASNADATILLDTYDFWIVPVANPDGYHYSWVQDRLWRKNRVPNASCAGVDLNRNFDAAFNSTSRNACSSSYGGEGAESERETQATVSLLTNNRYRIKAALFIHSFGQLWLSAYGVNTTLPADYPEMERVMSKAVAALKTKYGTEYQYGTIANTLYGAPGTAIDFCYSTLGIVHSYVVELRDVGANAFMLPIEQILPTAVETWDGIKALASAIKSK